MIETRKQGRRLGLAACVAVFLCSHFLSACGQSEDTKSVPVVVDSALNTHGHEHDDHEDCDHDHGDDHDHDHDDHEDCDHDHDDDHDHEHDDDHGHDHDDHGHEHGEATEGSFISLTEAVRDNLGIRFAPVVRRQVENTLRVPGAFEFRPEARREYRALLGGRIQLHTQVFEIVSPGDLLFTVDSVDWRRMQHEAVEAEGEIKMARAALAVAEARKQEINSTLGVVEERLARLAGVQVRRADLEAERVQLKNSVPRLDSEIAMARAALAEAEEHYRSRLNILASVTGKSPEILEKGNDREASWRDTPAVAVYASRGGVVESVAVNDGGWLDSGGLAMVIADPQAVWFHGEAPQADMARLLDGQRSRIVPPQGGSIAMDQEMTGLLRLGLTGHAADRSISVYVQPDEVLSWARPGVTAYLEVVEASAPSTLSIPVSALVQDGLDTIFYLRDGTYPEIVRPVTAELGLRDSRWVELRSGVKEGDEVVVAGAYALKVAGSASTLPEGYHVHADGSLHRDH